MWFYSNLGLKIDKRIFSPNSENKFDEMAEESLRDLATVSSMVLIRVTDSLHVTQQIECEQEMDRG